MIVTHFFSLTPDELLREADFCSRDAALRAREAALRIREGAVLRQEADLLLRAADLARRQEAQDEAEHLVPTEGDTSVFWDSLLDEPSDDESSLASSTIFTARTESTPSQTAPGTPTAPPHRIPVASPEPASRGDRRAYEVTSPRRTGLVETWCVSRR